MGKAINDLVSKKFGRLTVLSIAGRTKANKVTWNCACSCGTSVVVIGSKLKSGHTRSCGCLKEEENRDSKNKRSTHGHARGRRSRCYRIWRGILSRCNNPNETFATHGTYYAKGIRIEDPRWLVFENFLEDMGEPPDRHSIDRIDGSKGYCKENCRWATSKEQNRNRTSNVFLEWRGETLCIAEWAEKFHMNRKLVTKRLRAGWSLEEALTLPSNRAQRRRNVSS